MARKKFTTYLEEDVIKSVKIDAIKHECSVADILNELLLEYLGKAEI